MSTSSASASDRDLSECSSSPISYTRDSPSSSPSHQVPQLTRNLTGLTCTEQSFHVLSNGNLPHLRIIEQPQNHFRFRYVSEMVGTHGCLLGKSCASNKTKIHPTVQLVNYTGRALIRCRLAQVDNEDVHPHKLLEDEQDRDVSSVVPENNSYTVSFAGMGIIHTAKKDVAKLLFNKISGKLRNTPYNLRELRTECETLAKRINLNIVRLRFSAHDIDTGKEICDPVFSEPINNMKSAATNDLKICRISQNSGRPRGGDDIFMLVEKVNKKNIMIRFSEYDENGAVVWTDTGKFLQSDVHHQYAIVFRTPAYRDRETTVDVNVVIELVRPSDGRTSERKSFTYKAEEVYKQIKKRKNNSYSSIDSSSSGSISNEIPTTVLSSNPRDPTDVEMPLFTIQPLPIPTGSPSSSQCGLGSALGNSVSLQASPGPPQTSPMWNGYQATPSSPMPDLRLRSSEIEEIISRDVEMTPEHRRVLTDVDWSHVYEEYVGSFSSLSDIQTEEQQNPMDFIRASTALPLVSDSGRAKGAPSTSKSSSSRYSQRSNVSDKSKDNTVYDAFYKPEQGQEVKKLLEELCDIIRNKKGSKNQEVRSKLERLFEIRLSNGDTFLHMTLCSNQSSFESIVKVIHSVKMPHLLNYANNKQETILHLTIIHGTPQLVSLLVAKGCNPMLKNSEEENAIHYAVRYNKSCLEPLLDAIKQYNVPCDLNDCNSEKQTALHLAALDNCGSSATLLLKHGASHNVRDAAGRTALHLAAYDARRGVLRALVQHIPPSDIDAVDGRGNTALQIVCDRSMCQDTVEMVKMLLEKGADPLKHEEHNESAWRMSRDSPTVRDAMRRYVSSAALEDDVKSEPEDDIKSEPDDDFESADEDMDETGLAELSLFAREVSERLDAKGTWRELARRLRTDALHNWFASQPSPTHTLLHHVKECREDVTSKSLALILENMGEIEVANVIRGYLD